MCVAQSDVESGSFKIVFLSGIRAECDVPVNSPRLCAQTSAIDDVALIAAQILVCLSGEGIMPIDDIPVTTLQIGSYSGLDSSPYGIPSGNHIEDRPVYLVYYR